MSRSKEWQLIKRTLRWASIALEELTMSQSSNNIDRVTKSKIEQAKEKVAEAMRDPAIEKASELVEYNILVQKLQAEEMPITDEEINRAKRL